jgi:tRNA pseudouridine(55) synthase
MKLPAYVVIEKQVGETPLSAMERWRQQQDKTFADVPLAYAGRLDPMASGTLLVLVGDECKVQEKYHTLDKAYTFSVLFGVSSDTDDVLGRLTLDSTVPTPTRTTLSTITKKLTGIISLPYPPFSSKTVMGKPLHTWTLEGRLGEITIPTNTTRIYSLTVDKIFTISRRMVYETVSTKIETIPPVKDNRKALGNDFRRTDVRSDWKLFAEFGRLDDQFTIAEFTCIASSGTYMRSLAREIGQQCGTRGLAYHIHRTTIGKYRSLPVIGGVWTKRYE